MNLNATMIGQTISFIFFVFFCMVYIWPPIINSINNRKKKIRAGLIFSNQAKLDLILAKKIAKKKIEEAKISAFNIINEANKNKNIILKQAENLAKKKEIESIKKIKKQIKIQYQQEIENLKHKITNLSISIAEKIIQNSVNEIKSKKIVKKFFSDFT
ncbi:F0F1 ATP synthase subunit B [Buchnera aphidicola]|uniref:ATP synthase subunit b n=1 Tax=Buchnera aphidicola (Anoecia oenotherae) TaxID=1241833 RepID=A0A4D6XUG2_9GAMM|nr:F0F1 ATP synthase subunit B [Buchnera aphidicola]QCI19149.1 ATP synthase F0 subunit B [Buchnera aphidicola (Anoecia oenotherae)]